MTFSYFVWSRYHKWSNWIICIKFAFTPWKGFLSFSFIWAPCGFFQSDRLSLFFLRPSSTSFFVFTPQNGNSRSTSLLFRSVLSGWLLSAGPWLLSARWPLTEERWQPRQMSCGCVSGGLPGVIHHDFFFLSSSSTALLFSYKKRLVTCGPVFLLRAKYFVFLMILRWEKLKAFSRTSSSSRLLPISR